MTTRILVTGAQGFMGRYLTAHLLQSHPEAEVLGLGRSPRLEQEFTHSLQWGASRLRAPLPEELRAALDSTRYHYVSLDLGRQPELTGLLGEFQPQQIFHLASGLRDAPPDHLFRTNVEGTIYLLEAIREAGSDRPTVILGSTGFLYGQIAPDALPIHESTPCQPIDLYGVSKLASENAARILVRRHGIPAIWARIFNLVGPGQEERHFCGRLTSQAAAIAAGVVPPVIEVEPLTTTRDFFDVRDAARALDLLARKGTAGRTYNLASGVEAAIDGVFQSILQLAGLNGNVQIETKAARPADIPRYYADISRLQALGFAPEHCLTESLADLLAYYRGPVAGAARNGGRREHRSRVFASVEADRAHRYPVEIEAGLLETLPERLQGLYPASRMAVLTDPRVLELYGARLLDRLWARGVEADPVLLPEGEPSKSAHHYLGLIEELHRLQFDRRALLVNLGGGIVTDVGGFVAATYMRGVAYVNVPTTLLAQLDAAIGGKVAVNMPWAKNFLGAFAHPRAVFCDPAVLATLSARELSAGVAEALKVAIIGDPDLFELLETESGVICRGQDERVLGEVVARASEAKIAMLAPDPYERNLRRVLNLGHTFGHALEVQTGYDQLLHGEAVGFGIAVATALARRRGLCSRGTLERIFQALNVYDLPPPVARSDLFATCNRLEEIRLVRAGHLNFVLPREVGQVEIVTEVSDLEITQALEDIAAHPILGRCVKESSCVQSASTSAEASYSPA
ncbi:MAG TPA: 3-dehydroquinate synthase [Gemmatimonadales bacterium]|jgi:3-dehydroquinate synthase